MIIDSSAVLAVILGETDAEMYLRAMVEAEALAICAASFTEALIVAEVKQGEEAARDVHALLADLECDVLDVSEAIASNAFEAWRRFGKRRHPANLNYGDCLAYATAQHYSRPLLFKGLDFQQTDVASVL